MIVLDTNVVSELIRPRPDDAVVAWVNAQRRSGLYITATTVAELWFGVVRLAPGRRRRALEADFRATVDDDFRLRVLSYDRMAATHHAELAVARERVGRPID